MKIQKLVISPLASVGGFVAYQKLIEKILKIKIKIGLVKQAIKLLNSIILDNLVM